MHVESVLKYIMLTSLDDRPCSNARLKFFYTDSTYIYIGTQKSADFKQGDYEIVIHFLLFKLEAMSY